MKIRVKSLMNTRNAPNTQKARGIWALMNEKQYYRSFTRVTPAFLCVPSEDVYDGKPLSEADRVEGELSETCAISIPSFQSLLNFGDNLSRPCPRKPRHGFVDSVPTKTEQELRELFMRAVEADTENSPELIVMKRINASSSAIYIPESGVLVLGKGTDGATSGTDAVTLPIAQTSTTAEFREAAGIADGQVAYLELVAQGYQTYIVQARSGLPVVGGVSEYIPERMQITGVIDVPNDMMLVESLCQSFANSTGIVLWQPNAPIACHPAVQCMTHNIPFLTRPERPEIGQWIDPPVIQQPPFNWLEFQIGVRLSENPKFNVDNGLKLAIGLLHNSVPLKYSTVYSRLIGFAVGWVFRASAMACLGEARHYRSKNSKSKAGMLGTKNRESVYEKAAGMENNDLCTKLASFSYKFMAHTWASSYGGVRWYQALVKTVKLWNLISQGKHEDALSEANVLLNMAHNGGWLFNKFFGQDVMNAAAGDAGEYLARHTGLLWDLLKTEQVILPIKPRTYRASAKWKVQTDLLPTSKALQVPAAKNIGGKKQSLHNIMIVTNNIEWKYLPHTTELEQLLKETFEHI